MNSNTPRTDAEYWQWESTDDARDFCRQLERENAALRDALHDIMTESDEQVIWRMARAALERKVNYER